MTTPDRPADVTALRDALVNDIRAELRREGVEPTTHLRDRLDAIIAAVRADATRAAEAEVVNAVVDALMAEETGAGYYRWQYENIVRPVIRAALAAQPAAPNSTSIVWCQCGYPCPTCGHAAHPAAPEAEPERCADEECGHDRKYHDAPGEQCSCEGDGEAGFCICPGFTPAPR